MGDIQVFHQLGTLLDPGYLLQIARARILQGASVAGLLQLRLEILDRAFETAQFGRRLPRAPSTLWRDRGGRNDRDAGSLLCLGCRCHPDLQLILLHGGKCRLAAAGPFEPVKAFAGFFQAVFHNRLLPGGIVLGNREQQAFRKTVLFECPVVVAGTLEFLPLLECLVGVQELLGGISRPKRGVTGEHQNRK